MPFIGFGQLTYVPDDNFETYLENNGMGDGITSNDFVLTANINQLDTLNIKSEMILDMTGIEDFTGLIYLNCQDNSLTNLDVSFNTSLKDLNFSYNSISNIDLHQNIVLTKLNCKGNFLSNLDVSSNIVLTSLSCGNSQLTFLDLTNNTALVNLDCSNSELTSLDLTNNTDLMTLDCGNNYITCLDISNLSFLDSLDCGANLLEQLDTRNGNWVDLYIDAEYNFLSCVEVDNPTHANLNWWWMFDYQANFVVVNFSVNCNYANPCNNVSKLEEYTFDKKILKVIDILARETKVKKNEPLFYIYDDGTVEKRIIIE